MMKTKVFSNYQKVLIFPLIFIFMDSNFGNLLRTRRVSFELNVSFIETKFAHRLLDFVMQFLFLRLDASFIAISQKIEILESVQCMVSLRKQHI